MNREPTISAATVGQLTPVPWQILAPAAPAATPATPAREEHLQESRPEALFSMGMKAYSSEPNLFDVNRLNDLEKSEVSQGIFSHFGVDRNGGFMGTGIGTGGAPGTSDSAGTGINKSTAPGTRPIPSSPGGGVNTPTTPTKPVTPRKDGGGGAGPGAGTGR